MSDDDNEVKCTAVKKSLCSYIVTSLDDHDNDHEDDDDDDGNDDDDDDNEVKCTAVKESSLLTHCHPRSLSPHDSIPPQQQTNAMQCTGYMFLLHHLKN